MYQSGAIGFSIVDGVPKVGQLQVSAWSWTDTCRFRIVPGPPPLVRLAPPLPPGVCRRRRIRTRPAQTWKSVKHKDTHVRNIYLRSK